jgi:osmotically-inducible protein OsmY
MFHDDHLQQAVIAELKWEPSVDDTNIGVSAAAGVVTLTGNVTSFAQKHAVEMAVYRVKGVKGIADEIEVRLAFEKTRNDDEIALAAIDRLAWDVTVPNDAIKITVASGWITLTGEVDWHFQKEAAEQDVHRLYGIVGVSNQITIKPGMEATHIRDNIMHAMNRSWFFDPQTINVTAEGGKVRLTGTAHSLHDRQVAAVTAWTSRGVTDVENDITVV